MCYGRGLNSLSCAPYAKKKWEQFRLAVILWHETLNALFWHTIERTRNSKSLNSNKFSASISHNQPKELSPAQSGLCSQAFPGVGFAGYYETHQSKGPCAGFPLIISTKTSSLSAISETSKLTGGIRKYQHRTQLSQSDNSVRSKLDSQAASEDGARRCPAGDATGVVKHPRQGSLIIFKLWRMRQLCYMTRGEREKWNSREGVCLEKS